MDYIQNNRKTYIAACLAIAAIYAIVNLSPFLADELPPVIASEAKQSPSDPTLTPPVIASEAKQSPSDPTLTRFQTLLRFSALQFLLVDTIACALLLFLAGILLFNIYRYAVPTNYSAVYKNIFIVTVSLLSASLMLAIESLALYVCFRKVFFLFSISFYTRAFCILLIITIIRLLFLIENKVSQKQPHIKAEKPQSDRFAVRIGQKIKIIPHSSIQYIKADGDYVAIHTAEGSYLKELTMNATEDSLPKEHFIRIHRSYIVNVNAVSRIERYGEQRLVVLHNAEKIRISAARYQALKNILNI